ncbi:MAG TPA: uracil phosphoribosyltransferase, partial [Candidatus Kapabacteria bacterium]|nr:uracil phosphoribosyltransferase [Candidatus Kapabacteria bacterium]
EAFKFMMPSAKISFVGLSRNEKDFSVNEYYFSAPNFVEQTRFIILEMMIATGGSVVSAINRLQLEGASNFTVCSIISAPEGVENILTNYPNVKIITAALDRELNDKKYILPGLGDAGDRWCGV